MSKIKKIFLSVKLKHFNIFVQTLDVLTLESTILRTIWELQPKQLQNLTARLNARLIQTAKLSVSTSTVTTVSLKLQSLERMLSLSTNQDQKRAQVYCFIATCLLALYLCLFCSAFLTLKYSYFFVRRYLKYSKFLP
jgi:hypothetical protein